MFTEVSYLYYEKQKRKQGYLHNCQNRTATCVYSSHYYYQRWYGCNEACIPKAILVCHFNTLGLINKCAYSMKSNTQWVNEIVFIIVSATPSVELDAYL